MELSEVLNKGDIENLFDKSRLLGNTGDSIRINDNISIHTLRVHNMWHPLVNTVLTLNIKDYNIEEMTIPYDIGTVMFNNCNIGRVNIQYKDEASIVEVVNNLKGMSKIKMVDASNSAVAIDNLFVDTVRVMDDTKYSMINVMDIAGHLVGGEHIIRSKAFYIVDIVSSQIARMLNDRGCRGDGPTYTLTVMFKDSSITRGFPGLNVQIRRRDTSDTIDTVITHENNSELYEHIMYLINKSRATDNTLYRVKHYGV